MYVNVNRFIFLFSLFDYVIYMFFFRPSKVPKPKKVETYLLRDITSTFFIYFVILLETECYRYGVLHTYCRTILLTRNPLRHHRYDARCLLVE